MAERQVRNQSLPAQLIAAFIAVVLLTAATIGIPAIWLVRNQLDQQAWAEVEQGRRTTMALYTAQQREVTNLSILIAQRPTLHKLILAGESAALEEYLYTLENSAELNWIAVCDGDTVLAAAPAGMDQGCRVWQSSGYYLSTQNQSEHAWLIARQAIGEVAPEEAAIMGGYAVIAGISLNTTYLEQMQQKTGLEYILCRQDQPLTTSLPDSADKLAALIECPNRNASDPVYYDLAVDTRPFYSTYIPLNDNGLGTLVLLDVTDITATQNRLANLLVAGILSVSLAVSALGVLVARRISQPLVRLAEAAAQFARGDLQTQVAIHSPVSEVALVALALENARLDLLETLTNLQTERDWSEHLLASIVEGIVTLDQEQRLTYFSHGAERITGWSKTEVLGKTCDEIFQLAQPGKFSNIIPEPGKRSKVDVHLPGGRQASLAITRAQLTPSEAREAEIVLVFRDISEEEAVHRLLGHFLANVAHEFRTPLTALAASIELLMDQAPTLTSDELSELLTNLHLGTLSLETLVDNLLESASIEAGRFRVSPRTSDLGNIIAEATQTLQPLLDKYGQHLVINLPVPSPLVRADPRRINQVLVNLLGNASKYGPAEAQIEIEVTVTNEMAHIAVSDRGPGIPAAGRRDLFQRFVFPEEISQTAQAGAGLGLSVVKAIVEAHGGQVGVDNRPGGGSIFWFSLPLGNRREAA